MKNSQSHFLANILGCQPAGAEMPLELRRGVSVELLRADGGA
jgi:hypothetical protein